MTGTFLAVDAAFLVANLAKISHGGWLPLLIGAIVFAGMVTWKGGRAEVTRLLERSSETTVGRFLKELEVRPPVRVPGTAVFMTGRPEGIPPIVLHQLRHNKVLHQQVVLLTIVFAEAPVIDSDAATVVRELGGGLWRITSRFGYMQVPDVPRLLGAAKLQGLVIDERDVTYYLAELALFAVHQHGWRLLRDKLFVFLARNARRATSHFRLPPNQTVEIGMRLEL